MTTRDRMDELRRELARLEALSEHGPCEDHGHDWVSFGGANAGCDSGDECGCSVPVNVCRKCGDCDYGENEEARRTVDECRAERLESRTGEA